jgi:hypothetical protein
MHTRKQISQVQKQHAKSVKSCKKHAVHQSKKEERNALSPFHTKTPTFDNAHCRKSEQRPKEVKDRQTTVTTIGTYRELT